MALRGEDAPSAEVGAGGPVPGADLTQSHRGAVRPSRRFWPVDDAPVRILNTHAANPIARLGAVGDQATLALIDEAGALSYLCWPRLDSPLLFGDILGARTPSAITVTADEPLRPAGQSYDGDTNILVTALESEACRVEIVDCMDPEKQPLLVRRIRCTGGSARLTVTVCPTPDYGALPAGFVREGDTGLRLDIGADRDPAVFSSSGTLQAAGGRAWAVFDIGAGDEDWIAIADRPVDGNDARNALRRAGRFWREWSDRASFEGDNAVHLRRALLAAGLLHNDEFGTVAAAGTFGFPEARAGKRNWDYRYAWVRDTALGALAMARGGLVETARGWVDNVLHRNGPCNASPLRLMIAVDGGDVPDERQRSQYSGMMAALPVRTGNDAAGQLQLDIIGELVSAYRVLAECGAPPDARTAKKLRELLSWLGDNWERPDASIWELRGAPRHYLFSRVMSWVAFRDAIEMFEALGEESDPHWALHMASIRADIVANFWCPIEESYMQTRDKAAVDASCVFMRLCGFLEADDVRWRKTRAAVRRHLVRETGVLRFPHSADDGFQEPEGTFVLCTGWWIQTLCMDGAHDEARSVFATMMRCLGPTGLASEEIDEDGTLLGNVPQLFSHVAVMESVRTLEEGTASRKC